ncbi:MAG: hypothetical protein ACYTKD_02370 [Planctomycetota bacterium]
METKKSHILVLLALLVLVAVSSFVLGKHTGTKRQAWRSAVAAHHAAVDHCLALGEEVNKRTRMAWRARMPIAEFENQFGKPVPVEQGTFPEAREDTTHVYTHEPSHRVFYLRFQDGVLLGVTSAHGSDTIQQHLPSIQERLATMR